MSIGQTLKGYFWWTYPRGSLHYDVMVTLILAFIFLAPRWVDFGDKPPDTGPHPTAVLVQPDGAHAFIYQIEASVVSATEDREVRRQLKREIEPVSGSIVIDRYEQQQSGTGHAIYKVWAHR